MRTTAVARLLAGLLIAAGSLQGAETPSTATPPPSLKSLASISRERVKTQARVTLGEETIAPFTEIGSELRLGGATVPNYLRALAPIPQAVKPMADLVRTFVYGGVLPSEVRAAMGLRIAQINSSPYVAAHMERVLRGSEEGRALLAALSSGSVGALSAPERLALEYAESLTRSVHGVTGSAFEKTRGTYNDSEVVELTMTTCFFNYFTRYAEALGLPVEPWALEGSAPAPALVPMLAKARVGLISDEEMAGTAALVAATKEQQGRPGGWGIGVANSQRAMFRAPALATAWRAYGLSTREKETVSREIKLQVSFAVSIANDCRYCTLHQVLGLRRLNVDPAKLVAMRKDDGALTPREKAAVVFARKLTDQPGSTTDDDYAKLRAEFGETGALEVVLQTCNFAFMNRFTDGLLLPSEDEAIRVYQEVYGGSWRKEPALLKTAR
jgi:alkylhydroperoxidase family enzyme